MNQQLGSPVSPLQLRELYRSVSEDKSGCIEYEKFLGSFRLVDSQKSEREVGLSEFSRKILWEAQIT